MEEVLLTSIFSVFNFFAGEIIIFMLVVFLYKIRNIKSMYKLLEKHKLKSIHLMVIILGFTGILGKLITLETIHLVWYRMGLAFFSLALFLFWKKQLFSMSKKQVFKILGVGALVTFHWLCFFESIKVSTVSVAVVCLSTSSLFLL